MLGMAAEARLPIRHCPEGPLTQMGRGEEEKTKTPSSGFRCGFPLLPDVLFVLKARIEDLLSSKLYVGRRKKARPAMTYGEWMSHFGYERHVKILMAAELRVGPLLISALNESCVCSTP